MSTSLIGAMRGSNPFMRSTAATVLLTFLMLILQPTLAVAVGQATETVVSTVAVSSAEDQYSKTLQRIEAKLARLEEKFSQQRDSTLERNELKQLQHTLTQLDQTVRQGFHQVEQHITDKGLAAVIMERHQVTVHGLESHLGRV